MLLIWITNIFQEKLRETLCRDALRAAGQKRYFSSMRPKNISWRLIFNPRAIFDAAQRKDILFANDISRL